MEKSNFEIMLGELEEVRINSIDKIKKYQKSFAIITIILLAFIGIWMLVFLEYSSNTPWAVVLMGIVFILIIVDIIVYRKWATEKNSTIKHLKESLISTLVAREFKDGNYKKSSKLSLKAIKEIGLIKSPDRYYGEDYVDGYINDVFFQTSDVEFLERVVRSNGKTTYVTYETYFKGRWYIFDYNKDTNGVLKVTEKSFLSTGSLFSGLKKYSTESIEFNKKFKVLASNEQIVFYILTPRMITRISDIEARHRGKVYFGFINGKLHIGVNDNKSYLEPDITRPIKADDLEYILKDLEIIKHISDELSLDEKIFI